MSLYLYDLPQELLASLVVRGAASEVAAAEPKSEPTPSRIVQVNAPGGRTCGVCNGAVFADLDDQRAHFRSDWHRFNVKARLANARTVNEDEFAGMVDALDQSISGSESTQDDSAESGAEDDTVNRVLKRRAHDPSRPDSPEADAISRPRSNITWFHSPPATQIGVYTVLLPPEMPSTAYVGALQDLQSGGAKVVTLLALSPAFVSPMGLSQIPRQPSIARRSSTLRFCATKRFIARRKQGGSQSVNDNAKGFAKSAGAQLRRYGEQALREDIRGLLNDWREDIDRSELVWIRASVSNRRIFLDYEEAPFTKRDERLRTFPFPTRRPTQAELTRCINELTYVKTSHLTEEALQAKEEAYLASLPKPKPQPVVIPAPAPSASKPTAPRLTKEEELLRDKWRRLLEMIQKGRLEPLQAFWLREATSFGGANARIPDWTERGERGYTLLQIAARAGQEEVVRWLLEEQQADPTLAVEFEDDLDEPEEEEGYGSDAPAGPAARGGRRTAYDLTKGRATRDVFRRAAWAHPDLWDWHGAGRVAGALSPEMEEARNAGDDRRKARRRGIKDKMRERERERETATPSPPPPEPVRKPPPKETVGPAKLGGTSGAADAVSGLSAEMKARVERERRARAAEARLKALGGG
ncbi:hypothetical protein BKA62DRAFT_688291 [Auriculariales sp. MPI-PUGE-AT-0066]|nr:hypothetical protein BKA62DRAFT_688291 [Auriculariales sp. MPI-PUGE-AT-0066]